MRAAQRKYSKHDNKEKWSKRSEGVGRGRKIYLFCFFFKRKKNGMKFRISRSIEKSRRPSSISSTSLDDLHFLFEKIILWFFYKATIERSLFFFVFRFGSHCWMLFLLIERDGERKNLFLFVPSCSIQREPTLQRKLCRVARRLPNWEKSSREISV